MNDELKPKYFIIRADSYVQRSDGYWEFFSKVNPEEVVLCKDCRYSRDGGTECGYRKPYYFLVRPDGFCEMGVAR